MVLQYTVQYTCMCRKSRSRVSRNAITVHSIVYMYLSKESKQVSCNGIYFMQVNDPDANKSWYELGEEAGLEIVDDEEEEEEKMQKEEEDKEVVHIFKESKQCVSKELKEINYMY